MTNSKPREVYIMPLRHRGEKLVAYVVMYLKRNYRQRYNAGQFDPSFGLEYVKNWVNKNPKLKLVDISEEEIEARVKGR